MRGLSLLVLLAVCASVGAKVYLEEKFGDGWDARWKQSDWKKDEGAAGEWKHTAGKWFGDEEADKGIQTHPDARFYNLYTEMDAFNNEGKDLVIQYSVKHEQKIDCGGGYIKLIPASSEDQMDSFSGDTPYSIMFGPDICGFSTKRVHVILTYKGKNYLTKKNIDCKTDELTHVYTLVIKPDNTYQVYIDLEEKASGSLYEDWDMIPPRKIKDPEAKKPEDWDEREKIPDPEDKKPEGYDDIPEFITDPKATKPENWDDEEDGEWEAPQIPNPEYKGPWKPRMMDNPDYKGKWVAPEIDNPDFAEDDTLYQTGDLKYLGFELWQVKAGTIFDNIIVTDSFDEAKEFAESTWGKTKDAEMEMFNKAKEEEREKAEAEAAAKAEAAKEDDEYDVAADEDAEDAADDVKDEL